MRDGGSVTAALNSSISVRECFLSPPVLIRRRQVGLGSGSKCSSMVRNHLNYVQNSIACMIFRLSQKLSTKIKTGKLQSKPLDENPYADWSAHLFTADRTQYIILCNTASLYSVVMVGKGLTNDARFIERALSKIREFMEDDGQDSFFKHFIAPTFAKVIFAKSLNRSVTGSMNDLVQCAKLYLQDGISPDAIGLRLNNMPMSALANSEGQKYANPQEALKLLSTGRSRNL